VTEQDWNGYVTMMGLPEVAGEPYRTYYDPKLLDFANDFDVAAIQAQARDFKLKS
jgi:hypothetical protein